VSDIAIFRPQMVLFHNFGVNHAKDVTGSGGIACADYKSMPPRDFLNSLNLQKIALLNRQLIRDPYDTADGH
jgi:hypothetical protein